MQYINGFLNSLRREAQTKNPPIDCNISINTYFSKTWGLWILSNSDVFGDAKEITPSEFGFFDPDKPNNVRGIQIVYFPRVELLAINNHAPHKISLKRAFDHAIGRLEKVLMQIISERGLKYVIVGGDFNDDQGQILFPSWSFNVLDIQVTLPLPKNLIPKTCCTDSDYNYAGDYILLGVRPSVANEDGDGLMIDEYRIPEGFERWKTPMSDHDPLSAVISFSVSNMKEELKTLKGLITTGIIMMSGSHVEIRFDLDQGLAVRIGQTICIRKEITMES